jgi:hypothetical protein
MIIVASLIFFFFFFFLNTVRMSKTINFGKDTLSETQYSKNVLVVTIAPPDVSAKWLARMKIQDYMLYDKVEPEPSIETVNKVMAEFKPKNPIPYDTHFIPGMYVMEYYNYL